MQWKKPSETWKLCPPPKLQYGLVIAWVTAVASALQTVLSWEKDRPQAKTWVHDSKQTEQWIKPTMKQLLFHYQGWAAHGWRSREDLWQEPCLGHLHGLVGRRGKESALTRRRGIWVRIQRRYRKVESSRIFSCFVPNLCFTTNQDFMTVLLFEQNKPGTRICLCP